MNDITRSMIYNFRHDADGIPYVEETPYYMYPPEADPLPEPVEEAPWKNDRRNLLRRKKKRDDALNLNIPHPQQWKKNDNNDNNNNRRSLQLCQDIGKSCGYYGCACTNATKIII